MKDKDITKVISVLKEEIKNFPLPIVSQESKKYSPFQVLISTIISLRTKDEITETASKNLFKQASDPVAIKKLSLKKIQKAIYPAGFYKNKAKTIKELSQTIINNYNGKVPDELDELLSLKGVGRKTANLVLTLGFRKPGICVDTHVHRICNRWGYLKTYNPEQTEFILRDKLPAEYWIIINDLLVIWGQNICRPISPFCSKCNIDKYCEKNGVIKKR